MKGLIMKSKSVVLTLSVCVVFLAMAGYGYGWAKADKSGSTSKIAVVDIRSIFLQCDRNTEYKQKVTAEQNKILAELEKLNGRVEGLKADLKTRKVGSEDYMKIMQKMMQKQSEIEAKKQFYQQKMAMKDRLWTEELFKDIMDSTRAVAEKNGIEMVFAKDELELPASSGSELMLSIRTHKLLYSTGNLDITDKVLANLNGRKK